LNICCGDIEGDEVLSLYHLLKRYEQGTVNAEEMQKAINAHNSDLFLMQLPDDEPRME
jgi:hypothetical protein